MEKLKLNDEHRRWDRYESFHVGVTKRGVVATDYWSAPPFILFDTGEVICTKNMPRPHERGYYDKLNLSLLTTNDREMPRLKTPDGFVVPKAWFDDHGQQYMLIDHDSGHVVRVDGFWKNMAKAEPDIRPERFRNSHQCTAYIPGPGCAPYAPMPISVRPPLSNKEWCPLSAEEQTHIQMLVDTCRAELGLRGATPTKGWHDRDTLEPKDLLQAQYWKDLDARFTWALFHNRIQRPAREYNYLLLAD